MNIYQQVRFCWSRKRKWIIRLFWLNILIWFWPVLLGGQIYKEVIMPQEVSLASYERIIPAIPEPLPDTIKGTIDFYTNLYHINTDSFYKLIDCESKGKTESIGDSEKKYMSFGILQFQTVTFYRYAADYKIKNADIKDWRHQILLAVIMIANGHASEWSCSNNLKLKF